MTAQFTNEATNYLNEIEDGDEAQEVKSRALSEAKAEGRSQITLNDVLNAQSEYDTANEFHGRVDLWGETDDNPSTLNDGWTDDEEEEEEDHDYDFDPPYGFDHYAETEWFS